MKILDVTPDAIQEFMAREWAPENLRRFGRADPQMWTRTPGFLAAYEGEELVGAAVYYTKAGVAHLSELLVAANCRGRGIGSALVSEFENRASRRGCHKLTLVTYWDERAVTFYRKHAFAVEAILYRDVFQVDMCQMAKFIAETNNG